MRRFLTIPAAGVLALALAAPAMAGANVGNTSGSMTIAQGSWGTFDDSTGIYTYGYVAVSRDGAGEPAWVEYGSYSERKVQCTGAETPDDPDDDTFGGAYSNDYGYGDSASLTIGKSNASARASGSIVVSHEEYNDCTGEGRYEELGASDFSLELAATSATIRESGRGSFHIPGDVNAHTTYQAAYRIAAGTFDGPDGVKTVDGQIGKVTWRDHSNG
jgi:hypothetical protein